VTLKSSDSSIRLLVTIRPPLVLALQPWHRLGAPTDSLFVS
jgi:hypothetical protein